MDSQIMNALELCLLLLAVPDPYFNYFPAKNLCDVYDVSR